MSDAHPSIFELNGFVRGGSTSDELEAHVSVCDSCAERLAGLARRVASPIALPELELAGSATRLQAAVVALVACLAVLVVRAAPVTTVSLPEPRAPEGIHGIVVDGPPLMISLNDAGPVDSGVR